MLRKLFGRGAASALLAASVHARWADADWRTWEPPVNVVVGESHHLDSFAILAGNPRQGGYLLPVAVDFVREPNNPYDGNANPGRALTASLAIAVAALTVSTVRGWPTVLAAAAVAAYVLFTAWWVLRTMQTDMTSRFDALQHIIEHRQLGLGSDVGATIVVWKNGLLRRVRRVQLGLTAFALAIAVGGAVLGATLHRSTSPGSAHPTSPASVTPTVSYTPTP